MRKRLYLHCSIFVVAWDIYYDGAFPCLVSDSFHSRLWDISLLFLLSISPGMSGLVECCVTRAKEDNMRVRRDARLRKKEEMEEVILNTYLQYNYDNNITKSVGISEISVINRQMLWSHIFRVYCCLCYAWKQFNSTVERGGDRRIHKLWPLGGPIA